MGKHKSELSIGRKILINGFYFFGQFKIYVKIVQIVQNIPTPPRTVSLTETRYFVLVWYISYNYCANIVTLLFAKVHSLHTSSLCLVQLYRF